VLEMGFHQEGYTKKDAGDAERRKATAQEPDIPVVSAIAEAGLISNPVPASLQRVQRGIRIWPKA